MLAESVITAARAFLGAKETSTNSSPLIDAWLADVGIHKPSPWCVAFTFACYKQAAAMCGLANPHPRTAGSLRVWELARAIEPAYCQHDPQPGAVVVFAHIDQDGDRDGLGHVGIVAEVHGEEVVTCEGNTNGAGSRNGDQVAEHRWNWKRGKRGNLELVGFLVLEQPIHAT